MLLLGVSIGLLVIGYARSLQGDNVTDPRTFLALSKAREALLGYAATYREAHPNEVFGYLPCPDMGTGPEGQAAPGCSGSDVTVIGRLPWRTLDLPPLRDANGECLWYAVSGNFKNNAKTLDLLNRDTNGLIEVMAADGTAFVAGATPPQRAAAVIFAPGDILPGQNRSLAATNPPDVCGGNYLPANYLDTDIASGINNAVPSFFANTLTRFITAEHSDLTDATNDAFNDQLVTILPSDIFARHLDRRADFERTLTDPLTGMLRAVTDCLMFYGFTNDDNSPGQADYKFLPWAASLNASPFGLSTSYVDESGRLSGRLPFDVSTSATAGTHTNAFYSSVPLLDDFACSWWNVADEFWEEWKDHIFYAVGNGFKPIGHLGHDNNPCTVECLDVEDPDGTKTDIAAVVIFGGARLAGQSRNNDPNPAYTSTEKANPANYLEGDNLASIQLSPAATDPNRLFSKIDGNDTVFCLRTRLIGTATQFFTDPTCNASARCTTDGVLLAAFRSGTTNNCRVGTSGIDPTCEAIVNRIDINNCPGPFDSTNPPAGPLDAEGNPYSCEHAAYDFVSPDCLQGINTTKCTLAHSNLLTCQ